MDKLFGMLLAPARYNLVKDKKRFAIRLNIKPQKSHRINVNRSGGDCVCGLAPGSAQDKNADVGGGAMASVGVNRARCLDGS